MNRLNMLRWQLEVAAVRHGLWALPGALALLLALAAWTVWIPAREAELAQELAALAQRQSGSGAPPAQSAAPALPGTERAAAGVRQLFALAAEQGLKISQADYRRHETGRIGRWQVQVPATGNYPQVRRFVRASAAIPGLSLDEIAVRPEGSAGAVEARLLFSIWFSPEGKR